ncbi:histidinol-phosphate transaminase [Brooklawnia cerclae]|uniref:Aromatic amino acid aminotransferase n=1 Tax=Brooklawnia cerclae TaxID=349934 RepID=A0ABX0SFM7_9ACTN|nr:histidinol-phosphate transaminase [Brooklawnia cerclae]NIH57184.1 histidinol-phosphate aminotransferase [Brooklawnia cerclae]
MTTLAPSLRATLTQLPDYVPGRRASEPHIARLASNESHYGPLPSVREVVLAASEQLNRYPDNSAGDLRRRIATQFGVNADEIAVGTGSIGVLQQILAAMCDAGDEVVFAWRSFEAYPTLTALAGASAIRVPLGADEGHVLPAMAAAVTDRTRVVLICSPNNPTGTRVPTEDLERFLDAVPARVLVVVDEAYTEFADFGTDSISLFRSHPNVALLRTFSKAYGLAGLRVGYAIAHSELAAGLRRAALPFGVSALAQRAAIASLDAEEEIEARVAAVVAERRRIIDRLRGAGWSITESQANFVWLRLDDSHRERIVAAFDAQDVIVRGYAGDGVRITLADPATNDRVLAVLATPTAFGL